MLETGGKNVEICDDLSCYFGSGTKKLGQMLKRTVRIGHGAIGIVGVRS